MNYYIQGDAAKPEQIKAAFEKLGYDTSRHLFNAESVLYFTLNGEIRATTCNCTPAIIKTHPDYKELELPVEHEFKVGDWVVRKDGETFFGGNYAEQITLIEVDEKGKCIWLSSTSWVHDDAIRPWTIQDAKDGDVLVSGIDNPFIYNGNNEFSSVGAYIGISRNGTIKLDMFPSRCWTSAIYVKPATKEQRNILFAKMKEAGYQWVADKKELHKIQPHYDIANFYAGMPVLVRDDNGDEWNYSLFSHYRKKLSDCFFAGGSPWFQCIPYEGNEHLLGTTDMCDEQYINW